MISFLLVVTTFSATDHDPSCSPFHEIYDSGTQLCEMMFGDAFVVASDEASGYTMWFFDESNPNNAITDLLHGEGTAAGIDTCDLQYYHKGAPGPEDERFTECHPWKENACCEYATVPNVTTLRTMYGAGYEWDRCGPMSQACERFFVQEACFYECEPSAGLYLKHNDTLHPDYNTWEMKGMPIKKSYCDAWYTACYNDYFCGAGNYFDCETEYWANLAAEESNEDDDDNNNTITWILVSILGALILIFCMFSFYMVRREKQGQPMFAPLSEEKRTPQISLE